MRVLIKTDSQAQSRCYKCNKKIKFGEHYTIVTTYPKSRTDLKMDYKLRECHYPDCKTPLCGFGKDGMGKSYII